MKFSREKFVYAFNGSACMTMNMRPNLANEWSRLHDLLIDHVKLKYAKFNTSKLFFKLSMCMKMAPI